MPEEEFAEQVTIDWMDRRKQLGETLDEEDPKSFQHTRPTQETQNYWFMLLLNGRIITIVSALLVENTSRHLYGAMEITIWQIIYTTKYDGFKNKR